MVGLLLKIIFLYVYIVFFFLKGDTSACDQEVAEIVSAAEDGTIGDNVSFFSFTTLSTYFSFKYFIQKSKYK